MVKLFYLLCGFAILGVIDIGYFHIYRFKLYRLPASRGEQVTHLLRTILFFVALSWVMFTDAQGIFSFVLPVILLADFINSMVDVLLEPKSRIFLGGLPPLEYFVHMVTMFVSGAIMAVALMECGRTLNMQPRLSYRLLEVPPMSLILGWQILVVTIGFCLFEGVSFVRSVLKAKTDTSTISSG